MEIEKALGEVAETPAKWSRNGGTKNHNFLKKRIKPGTIRHLEYDLLDVEIGESWPIPVSVVHGSRPMYYRGADTCTTGVMTPVLHES